MYSVVAIGIIAIVSKAAFGQASAPAKTFEVISIKPAPPPPDGRLMIRMGGDAGRIDYTNVTLRDVIRNAYKVKDRQISGPDWLTSERFNIAAKFPAGATKDDVPAMLQALLADRFKLACHKESKVMPVYALLPAKGGPKLQPATEPAEPGRGGMRMMMGPKGVHVSGKMTMAQLAESLSNFNDRIVVDMTGLNGTYDIDMEFLPEGGPIGLMRMGPPPGGGPGGGPGAGGEGAQHREDADAPTLFTAIQEKLGLKLEAQKAPVDVYIIDHAEKVPSEN